MVTERQASAGRLGAALLLSLLVHGAAFASLERAARLPLPKPDRVVDVEIHEAPPPPPPAPVLPPPEPPKPKIVPVSKIARRILKEAPPPPPHPPPPVAAPPPPNRPVPPSAPPAPIHIGVSLESTVAASDFATPVGNTLYGAAPKVAPSPAKASQPYWAPKYVPAYQVAEMPSPLSECKVDYPPKAKTDGIEGDVVMMVTIDSSGTVAAVKRVSGPGHGLDEAAVAAMYHCRWKPARSHGEAVATEIRYTYSFEIE